MWSDFDHFEETINQYMPYVGEGETVASQTCTAVNKLIYKWFNDGDVFDNNHDLEGWCNDISSCANWIYQQYYDDEIVIETLERIYTIRSEEEYEVLLFDLATHLLDREDLEKTALEFKVGSIYKCYGPFYFTEQQWDDEEEEDW